ncbi:MAG: lipoprotein-releasing ABC transporter permease subunit [Rhizobiales bacterium]|nr:lipoprotein-releasing ABC transporter permease subunit [Hyphomicrobiales bacterium]
MATGTKPFSAFEWMLSLRYLGSRRKEGFISVIAGFSFVGILLGVATLIIVMAVMNGFRQELLGKILGMNGHVVAYGQSGVIPDYDAVTERLKKVAGVTRAIPYVEGQVMASSQRTATGVLVRGLREGDLKSLPSINNSKLRGSLDDFDGSENIAIGTRLAFKHRVGVGGEITLISPRGPVTPFGVTPTIRTYKIAAVFEIGMSEYDSSYVFLPFKEAQKYFVQEKGATAVELLIERPDKVDDFVVPLQMAGGPSLRLFTWKRTNETFFNALQVERNVMFLILTLIILVAALNIVSGLIMLVKDKGRDIAILRTMGATRGTIMRVFLITGASIGVVGTIAGLAIGLIFCTHIEEIRQFLSWLTKTELFSPELYYLSRLPAEVDPNEVITIAGMSFFLSVISTIYPSWRAARLDPVKALRYE